MNILVSGLTHMQTFLWGTYLGVKLLSWIVYMCSISEYKAKLFPKMVAPVYTLISNVYEKWWVHTLSDTWCFQAFSFLPTDCVWNSTSLWLWFAFLPLMVSIPLNLIGQIHLLSSEECLCVFFAHLSTTAGAFLIKAVPDMFSILILCLLYFFSLFFKVAFDG